MGVIISPRQMEGDEEESDFIKPKFYRGREGPKFRLINFTRDYEYREYQASTWIAVRVSGEQYSKAVKIGHSALTKYLKGKNGPEREMNETCPLRTQVIWNQDLENPGEFIVSLHLPWENQKNPPSPLNKELFIQDQPKHFAYVAAFGATANDLTWKDNVANFARVLDSKGIKYSQEVYYMCQFDQPFRIGRKHHNEVIFPAS